MALQTRWFVQIEILSDMVALNLLSTVSDADGDAENDGCLDMEILLLFLQSQ